MSQKAIFVVGTTASGKTDWAFEQALKIKACILNCDSIQMYEGLDVGSAQPSKTQKSHLPHYLFSFVKAPHEITAGEYRRHHMDLLKTIESSVFVVGGTGFYFQALEKGMFPAPAASPEIQAALEEKLSEPGGEDVLWQELHAKDAVTAARIHKHDHYRLVRALELIRREGRPLSEIKNEFEAKTEKYPWPYLKIGVYWERDELLERVQRRTRQMLAQGLIEETQSLLGLGLESWAPLSSVGYKETVNFLKENKSKDWLFEEIVRSTMKLAKKQKTWFQRDKEITWFHGRDDQQKFGDKVDAYIHTP